MDIPITKTALQIVLSSIWIILVVFISWGSRNEATPTLSTRISTVRPGRRAQLAVSRGRGIGPNWVAAGSVCPLLYGIGVGLLVLCSLYLTFVSHRIWKMHIFKATVIM
jgi:hypothetical protein